MKDLSTLGFGPPELGLPKGKCKHGHLWANNLARVIDKHGKAQRYCMSCTAESTKRSRDKRRGEKSQRWPTFEHPFKQRSFIDRGNQQ